MELRHAFGRILALTTEVRMFGTHSSSLTTEVRMFGTHSSS
jgi:hypothetical protein